MQDMGARLGGTAHLDQRADGGVIADEILAEIGFQEVAWPGGARRPAFLRFMGEKLLVLPI